MAFGNLSASRSLSAQNNGLVTCKVMSDGQDISTHVGVMSISIQQAVNKVGFAVLQISDGDIPGQRMPVSDQNWFVLGKEIEIQLGYNLQENTVFKGIVTRHEVKVLRNRPTCLVVEVRDPAYRMTRLRKSAYYDNITDSDVFRQIANDYDLSIDVDSTTEVHPTIVQHHCSDWDFLLTRADRQGMLTLTRDGSLIVKKPALQARPVAVLSYVSQQIIEFESCIDARNSVPGVVVGVWSPEDQEMANEHANPPVGLSAQGNLSPDAMADVLHNNDYKHLHGADLKAGMAQEWADAQLLRFRLAAVRGRVCIMGRDDIRPMDWIAFDGFGERFNGQAFVSAVRHEVYGGTWYTHIEFGLDPEMYGRQVRDLAAPPAGGLHPPVHGLHTGVVTKIEDDSANTDGQRIRVRIPSIQPDGDGVWARLNTPFASDGYGWAFRPDIGDEVLVGFLDDDPNHPVILGSLYSQNRASPVSAADSNPEKGIFLREGMQLVFNDDEKSATLLTSGGNKLVLHDNDQKVILESQHGAKLEMNSQGITLDAGSGSVTINGTRISLG